MKPLNWLTGTFWLIYAFIFHGRKRHRAEILPMEEFIDRLVRDIERLR